ncbi:MAG: DUF4860 domain-containing protein [Lachnospiraceae bacterium]|nr:DUF4860 domain-containing protein [Lachnospiraceae bacterium]
MDFKQKNKHIVDILFVITLFCVFAVSALMLVIIGSRVYKNTVSNMDYNYNTRTSFAYITEKIRQFNTNESIQISDLDGHEALLLSTVSEEDTYYTYIYMYDGYLKELFIKSGTAPVPDAGQNILPLTDFQLTQVNEHLYQFYMATDSTNTCTLYVSTRCEN